MSLYFNTMCGVADSTTTHNDSGQLHANIIGFSVLIPPGINVNKTLDQTKTSNEALNGFANTDSMSHYFSTMRGVADSDDHHMSKEDMSAFFNFERYEQDRVAEMANAMPSTPVTEPAIGIDAYAPTPAPGPTPGNATVPGPAPAAGAPIIQPGAHLCVKHLKFHRSRATERLVAQRLRNGQYTCSGKYCGPVATPNTSCDACRQRLRARRLRKKLALAGNGDPPTGGGAASSA
ncbi:hypothetical protein B0H65DRAFT_436735 [Neurospora tetraspora]|uniref:Uncharacterized protein n=1 Tax=Neurospora tetraspora TaxID=94610 RepID=A0AAE0J0C3_9PEZI|nr:hypothetical protein B0H65DRAFT_436735 [Neurospora tetraspora]